MLCKGSGCQGPGVLAQSRLARTGPSTPYLPTYHPPDDEMTITKCRPTKVQCSHSPGSLLSETQDKALDIGHCRNPKNNVNSVLRVLFDTSSQNAFHFCLILSHVANRRTGCCLRMIHATVRHTCKAKSSGNCNFVIAISPFQGYYIHPWRMHQFFLGVRAVLEPNGLQCTGMGGGAKFSWVFGTFEFHSNAKHAENT